ncbi:MAG: tetratricopeptide repeat protein [Candidatus Liptonbacteria bacterium]|nr:tetratricopeptide repeat protein [Candidatus Liptonbacteria bacterium]
MHSRRLLAAVKFLLYLIVIGTPIFYFARAVYPYGIAKSLFFQAAVELLFALWLVCAWYEPKFRISWTPLMKALAAFASLLILTALLGVDPWRSFWSIQERAVGVFTILHVLAFTVVVRSLTREICIEPLFYASLGTAAAASAIAFLQLWIPNLLLNEGIGSRPGSTFGNPAFFAGYLALNLFIAGYFVFRWLRARQGGGASPRAALWFPLGAGALLAATLLLTETRGDILGVAAGVITLFALFVAEPLGMRGWLGARRTYLWALAAIAAAGLLFFVTRGSAVWQAIPGLGRFADISLESESLSPRFIAMRAAWKGFLERPLAGWGWDNYNIVFNKYYDPRALEANYQETRFDKPHNFVLEYLVAGGLPLALAYAAVFAALFWEAWRLRDRVLGKIFIAAGIAYAARNLFVFETLGPLLMWGLFLGCADGFFAHREDTSVPHANSPDKRIPARIVWAAVAVAAVPIYVVNVLSLQASHYQFWGFNYFVNNRPQQAIESFRKALTVWSPYTWNLKRDYATAVAEAYFYNPDKVPAEEAWRAVRAMEEATKEHPLDAYGHYALVDMYNQISDLAPEMLLPLAEREAATALALSPNRQEVYFSLAKTKSLQGDNAAALELLKTAMALAPKVPDAHFYYGLIAYTVGDAEAGYAEIKKALALGRRWRKYHEPRVVANLFADSGHLDEAIELYRTAIDMEPGDLEARAKLGIAHFVQGDAGVARQYLEEVSRRTDLRESPSYASLKPILDKLGIKLRD